MSGKGGKKRSSALAQLESHLKGPKDELQELLYPTSGTVDYEKLRKLLKTAGEADPGKLSKSQVSRAIERLLRKKKLSMNQVRKALGKPERDDTEDEEEDAPAAAKKGPAKKKAKTTPEPKSTGILGGIVNVLLSPLSMFSPKKK